MMLALIFVVSSLTRDALLFRPAPFLRLACRKRTNLLPALDTFPGPRPRSLCPSSRNAFKQRDQSIRLLAPPLCDTRSMPRDSQKSFHIPLGNRLRGSMFCFARQTAMSSPFFNLANSVVDTCLPFFCFRALCIELFEDSWRHSYAFCRFACSDFDMLRYKRRTV